MIGKYLDELEARLDAEIEGDLYRQWKEFIDGGFGGDIFVPKRLKALPPAFDWPKASVNAAFADCDAMVLQQFGRCSQWLAEGQGRLLNVRANYGTSILPSLFGVEMFMMDEELDTLPTSWPLDGGADAIRRIVDRGLPDIRTGLGGKVLDMAERFADIRVRYPNIGRWVYVYHPDLQGPMDVVEVVWGSGIFLELVDRPDLVKAFLDLVTQGYIRLMNAWDDIVGPAIPGSDGRSYAVHWETLHKGHVMLRDDSAMNLSPAMYDEFVRPYDQRVFDALGGGAIHFCGRGDHYIESLARMNGIYAVQMSQPEYNDMETIFANTVDRGIRLLSQDRASAEKALAAGRDLKGSVHCER